MSNVKTAAFEKEENEEDKEWGEKSIDLPPDRKHDYCLLIRQPDISLPPFFLRLSLFFNPSRSFNSLWASHHNSCPNIQVDNLTRSFYFVLSRKKMFLQLTECVLSNKSRDPLVGKQFANACIPEVLPNPLLGSFFFHSQRSPHRRSLTLSLLTPCTSLSSHINSYIVPLSTLLWLCSTPLPLQLYQPQPHMFIAPLAPIHQKIRMFTFNHN